MGWLELSERDRKRYDLPERVEFAYGEFGLRSIKALRVQTGFDFEQLTRAVQGVPRRDPETGDLAVEDDIDDDGNPVLNDDGSTKKRVKLFRDEDAMVAMVWLVLYDAGYRVAWDTFDVMPLGLRMSFGDDEPESPGKDETETTTSPTS